MRRVAAVAVATLLAGSVWLVTNGSQSDAQPTRRAEARSTVTLERRDLVERRDLDGTLRYADERTLMARRAGTVTWLRREGATVRRGQRLFEVDASATRLLYGKVPAWRDFVSGMSSGDDVRNLERNLVAMGYDPERDIDVDRSFDWATSAAIRRWEDDLGEPEDGRLALGDVAFAPGPLRVGERKVSLGANVAPGAPVATMTSPRRVVTLTVEARQRSLVRRGLRARVEFPDGSHGRARITRVGTVAQAPTEQGGAATIEVEAALLTGPRGWDRAPVEVAIEVDRATDVLAAPVAALLALAEGGYAVEVVDGSRTRLVGVDLGAFASGWVAVRGEGLTEGMKVVVAE